MLRKIRSKKILGIIFENLKKRVELKILKYNKKLLYKLNLSNKDFENFIYLKEFNNKYDLNLKDIEIKKLNLENKRLGNNIFEDLANMNFNYLNELNLNTNNITDLNNLTNAKFDKLEIFNLNMNEVRDISILENVNWKLLKELKCSYNKISDIKV